MKRPIQLFIGSQQADFDEDSIVLLTYAVAGLQNPAVIRNSFSRTLTLPGTPGNDRLFGQFARSDRRMLAGDSGTGAAFNPLRRVPFSIYNATSEVLASGYAKLDAVKRGAHGSHTYEVSLYGGLGDLIWELTYNADGSKRTLADIDYLNTGASESELDFTIDRDAVLEAWDVLGGDAGSDIWTVLNFAPTYGGIPENFDAKKAIAAPAQVDTPAQVTDPDSGKAYGTVGGYALYDLPEALDEWEVGDLRSYLQRPVLSVSALLSALSRPENAGGYAVDFSNVSSDVLNLWLTLPTIPSLGGMRQSSESATGFWDRSGIGGDDYGLYYLDALIESGTTVNASLNVRLRCNFNDGDNETLENYCVVDYNTIKKRTTYHSVTFVQLIALNDNEEVCGGGPVVPICAYRYADGATLADFVGYAPDFSNMGGDVYTPVLNPPAWDFEEYDDEHGAYTYVLPVDIPLTCQAPDATHFKVVARSYNFTAIGYISGANPSTDSYVHELKSPVSRVGIMPELYEATGTYSSIAPTQTGILGWAKDGTFPNRLSLLWSTTLRTGAAITKRLLLSSSGTPADYLTALCKTFGWYILADTETKTATVLRRTSFFRDRTIDLTRRLDLSRDIDVRPALAESRWYKWAWPSVGGAYAEQYRVTYGREYGAQYAVTGYEFDAEEKDILKDTVLRSCASVSKRSRYLHYWTKTGAAMRPAVFQIPGSSETLYKSGDYTDTYTIGVTPSLTHSEKNYNNDYPGCDLPGMARPQLHDGARKPLDGTNILLRFDAMGGYKTYPYFAVTDDDVAMDILNGGKACWLLGAGTAAGIDLPTFSTYGIYFGPYTDDIYAYVLEDSLDWGDPRELDIPGVMYEGRTLYAMRWQRYVRDRLNPNTRIVTVWADLSGLQVDTDLLRNFYFWDGALWTIAEITNYAPGTDGPTQLTLVQVQDKANYLNY